ncbi:DUF3137 domain-containing protein [bacterium]|nr:DUF3137 domain-containing protein [bacterium]
MDIQEKQDLKNKFTEHLMKNVMPILNLLEPTRQKELMRYGFVKVIAIMAAILAPVLTIIFFLSAKGSGTAGLLIFLFLIMPSACLTMIIFYAAYWGTYFYRRKINNNFKKLLKDNCMPKILSFFDEMKYKDQEIQKSLFQESGLFPSFDLIRRDDIFTGKYNDIWYHIEELYLYKVPGLFSGRFGTVSFKGVVVVFPANKYAKTQTIITAKKDTNIKNRQPYIVPTFIMLAGLLIIFIFMQLLSQDNSFIGFAITLVLGIALIYLIFDTIEKSKKYEDVNLEDISFDKQFSVYSKDQVESRYLVTPAFMDKLKDLQTAFGTNNVKCSFWGNRVMLAISTDDDLFEVGNLDTPLSDTKQICKFVDELTSIYDMIDYFKSMENTGL